MSAGRFGSDRSVGAVGSASDPFSADAWVTNDFGSVFGGDGQQGHAAGASGVLQREVPTSRTSSSNIYEEEVTARQGAFLSVDSAISSEDPLNPAAGLDYYSANMYPQALQHRVMGTALQNPTVDATSPDSTGEGSFGIDRLAGIMGRRIPHTGVSRDSAVPLIQMKAVQQLDRQAQASDDPLNGLEVAAAATPARAASSGGGERCEAGDIRRHPFVRLPLVNPRDIRRRFREQFALSLHFGRSSPMQSYTTMRRLFAKASLTPEDVEMLMTEAELLASYAAVKLSNPLKKRTANYLFVKLSYLFMAFDHLVCAVELLGEKMNTVKWWAQFVKKFDTDFFLSEPARMERTEELSKLVNRLSAALAIYKEGKRPPVMEVIELKRAVLTQQYRGSQLSNPLWKLWVQDDIEFCCNYSE